MDKHARRFGLLLTLTLSLPMLAWQGLRHGQGEHDAGAAWPEFERGMEKMHVGMGSIRPSGDDDVDFVRLMLPHHQAAIAMAKTELMYGRDPQMRRLAQEIITDQQSETELMQLWLKRHASGSPEKSQRSTSQPEREK